jgi:hypothetical protein
MSRAAARIPTPCCACPIGSTLPLLTPLVASAALAACIVPASLVVEPWNVFAVFCSSVPCPGAGRVCERMSACEGKSKAARHVRQRFHSTRVLAEKWKRCEGKSTPWRPAYLFSLDREGSRRGFRYFRLHCSGREGGPSMVLGLGNAAASAAAKRRCWNAAGTNTLLFSHRSRLTCSLSTPAAELLWRGQLANCSGCDVSWGFTLVTSHSPDCAVLRRQPRWMVHSTTPNGHSSGFCKSKTSVRSSSRVG